MKPMMGFSETTTITSLWQTALVWSCVEKEDGYVFRKALDIEVED